MKTIIAILLLILAGLVGVLLGIAEKRRDDR